MYDWHKHLTVCSEAYRQQLEMHQTKTRRVGDRIFSISQPHVYPIKRAKGGRDTKFGAKRTLSAGDRFSFADRLGWDNYNQSPDLPSQIDACRECLGGYPASVHGDKTYRRRTNRSLCQSLGVRMSRLPLGRPSIEVSRADRKQA